VPVNKNLLVLAIFLLTNKSTSCILIAMDNPGNKIKLANSADMWYLYLRERR
jgi:hypothetical protein